MADKSVPSSGSTGPFDFSDHVRSNFASPAPQPHITVHIYLSGEEAEKVTVADVSAAVNEMLARLGVAMGQVDVAGPGDP